MTNKKPFWITSRGAALLSLGGAVIYFLLMEHRTHLFQYLPVLILLLCPAMHLYMHSGHDHGGQAGQEGNEGANHQHPDATNSDAYQRGVQEGRRQALTSSSQQNEEV